MPFTLIYPESYIKRARKFFSKHPDLIKQYSKTLELLELNPQHPALRLHKLKGKLQGLSSVSINIQYRIVLEIVITDKEILLINIGDHGEVY